jgi:inhibitor of KinA
VTEVRLVSAGDAALVVELPARIDPATRARAVAIAEAARRRFDTTIRDVVVGYCTVTVYFDPAVVDPAWLEAGLRAVAGGLSDTAAVRGATIEVPVCYGGDLGPDLAEVATFAGCTQAEAIEVHCRPTYRVYVVGFVPGFPYMASVDPRIALPRRATPRTRVPPGSVAIAAGQTGIYPSETPGGWHIIGRTWVKPYDGLRSEPCLFRPGDEVRFHAVSRDEFERHA